MTTIKRLFITLLLTIITTNANSWVVWEEADQMTNEKLGYNVVKLKRIKIGEYVLGDLKIGKFEFFDVVKN